MSPEAVEAIRTIQAGATLLVSIIVCVAIVMIYNACPDPNVHPQNRRNKVAGELCKLHQRTLDQCAAMHEQDPPEDPKEDA